MDREGGERFENCQPATGSRQGGPAGHDLLPCAAAEKYLKAYLAWRSVEFPKTHAMEKLFSLMPAEARPAIGVRDQALPSEYGVAPRYPGWADVSLSEVRGGNTCPACPEACSPVAAQRSSAPEETLMEVWYKTGARHLRGVVGVFDSHTLPPACSITAMDLSRPKNTKRPFLARPILA